MNGKTLMTRLIAAAALGAALFGLSLPAPASAHPLGNFTVNVYNGLTVSADWTHLDRVVDMAELPTVTARQAMDTDGNGEISNNEAAAWATAECTATPGDLSLSRAGRATTLEPRGAGISFPPGQANLPTLRLVCTYVAANGAAADSGEVAFADRSYGERRGWREIVVDGRAATLAGAEQYAPASQRLRAYPTTDGTAVLSQSSATFTLQALPGVEPGPPPVASDAVPLGSPSDRVTTTSPETATVPGGVDLPAEIRSLIGAGDLSLPAILVAVLVAALVGAFHAATPGHGKTLMAAYLVGSRGTARHALALGITVTIAHTIGVLALGALVVLAGAALPAERLFPVLGLASGVVVTALGVAFLFQRYKAVRTHSQNHDHHDHDHETEEEAGWHSHAAFRHTHLPVDDGPLRRRNLVALGLVGGLVPSASAILILVGSIAAGRPEFGILLTVAFGAGMAVVLVGVGVLLVHARALIERLPSRNVGRLFAYAPIVTAVAFVIVGAAISAQFGSQL